MESCWSIGNTVEGKSGAAGICVSCIYGGTVKECYNSSDVYCSSTSTSDYQCGAGGIESSGIDGEGTIVNCVNAGNITAPNSAAGGIIGSAYSKNIEGCYNVGSVSGVYAGGLIGKGTQSTAVKNSYNVGTIDGSTYYGGIAAELASDTYGGTISNSYCLTNLVGNLSLDGVDEEDVIINSVGNKTTSEMQSSSMIDLLNNDIETEYKYIQDTNNINNGYPILSWQT